MRYLFVLSHMRSGSSLLAHLLGSHPEIAGYGELHRGYRAQEDLDRLVVDVEKQVSSSGLSQRYVLDKILHNRHEIHPHIATRPDTLFVFLLREPNASISSLNARLPEWCPAAIDATDTYNWSVEQYRMRLMGMRRLARTVDDPTRCCFVTFEQLLGDTRLVFSAIESMLKLESPLSEEYSVVSETGKPGFGDTSEHIHAGRILRDLPKRSQPDISQSGEHVELYQDTCRLLGRYCRTTDGHPVRPHIFAQKPFDIERALQTHR